jgi:hypothetical protein
MPRSRPTRTTLVLLLLAVFAAPGLNAIGGRPARENGAAQAWGISLAWDLWQRVSGFWAAGREELGREGGRGNQPGLSQKEGCRVDPNGACLPALTTTSVGEPVCPRLLDWSCRGE